MLSNVFSVRREGGIDVCDTRSKLSDNMKDLVTVVSEAL